MSKDDLWARALDEAESPDLRDRAIWARCFAQAGGDEAKAKAAYIQARAGGSSPAPAGIVTTQQTGKSYKAAQAAGALLMIAGVVACAASGPQDGGTAGPFMFLGGCVLYAVGRVGAWWNHG